MTTRYNQASGVGLGTDEKMRLIPPGAPDALLERDRMPKSEIAQSLGKKAINTYARLDAEVLYSEAFHSLSKSSILVLLRFLQKRPWHIEGKGKKSRPVYSPGPLVFPQKEAKEFGISQASFTRAIDELYQKGFIAILHQGGSIGNGTDPSQYELIKDYLKWETPEFKARRPRKAKQHDNLKAYNAARRQRKAAATQTESHVNYDCEPLSEMTAKAPKRPKGVVSRMTANDCPQEAAQTQAGSRVVAG